MPDAHILSPESAVPTARVRPSAIELYLKYLRFRRYYLPQIRVILSVVLLFHSVERRPAPHLPAFARLIVLSSMLTVAADRFSPSTITLRYVPLNSTT